MYGLIFSLFMVVVILLITAFVKKIWMRVTMSVILYLCVVFFTAVEMGGIRVQIEQARSSGKSEDYISGMVERDKKLQSARIEILVYGFGLLMLSVAGWIGPPGLYRDKP